jgi:4-amino-4-deoxy-L-arabinose transferase-like glycosyltransferase
LQFHGSAEVERSTVNAEAKFVTASFVLVIVLYFLSLSIPLFGDSLGYGYSTARWIRSNGYTPFASGAQKGEQAMGHPSLFFWLWAIVSGVFGKTLWVARFLPAIATFLSMWGMYRLGRLLSCGMVGWFSALALIVSPLFITQAMRPMPESAVIASVVWSLYFYAGKRFVPAALLCALAVAFREQAVFLAAAYFLAELFQTGVNKPERLFLFLSPLLVIIVTGLVNLAVNGYFFFPTYVGTGSQLEPHWFVNRLRLFGSHILSEDFRWLPVTVALAGMIRGKGRDKDRRLLPFVFILLFPALFSPPERIAFLVFAAFVLAVYFIRERLVLSRLHTVFAAFPVLLVMFHVFIVLVSPDSALNLFRYVMPAYAVIIPGAIAMIFRYYPVRAASVLVSVFVVATALANRSRHCDYQPDTSLSVIDQLMDYKQAALYGISLGDTMLVSGIDKAYFDSPECGVVDSAVPSRNILGEQPLLEEGVSYTLVVSSFMLAEGNIAITEALLPSGSELRLLRVPVWDDDGNTVEIYRVEPILQ